MFWGEGDTTTCDLPVKFDAEILKASIGEQVDFFPMFMHGGSPVPRLVSIQTVSRNLGYNSQIGKHVSLKPLYRHPNDEEPPNFEMKPFIATLLSLVERATNCSGLNHVLIQKYRDGKDNIQMHSDKTLDLSRETPIFNLSFGTERVLKIRRKSNKSDVQLIPLIHGEIVVFGLKTNQYWYHEVPKKLDLTVDPIFGTERISFTFRKVETFSVFYDNCETGIIIGQGSPYSSLDTYLFSKMTREADTNSSSGKSESNELIVLETEKHHNKEELIKAFSKENKLSDSFDWHEVYGDGFLCR